MRKSLYAGLATLALSMIIPEADAQSRMGRGRNLGKQRPAPMQQEAAKPPVAAPGTPANAPAAAPANAANPGATAPAVAPKPSFMQRWGGLLAGLGIGALLASLFGAQLGPIIGMLLLGLILAAVVFMLYRLFAGGGRRAQPAPAHTPAMAFSGIGSKAGEPASTEYRGSAAAPVAPVAADKPQIDPEPFLRVAKTSFIRLQAANDARDLDDIRDYTSPEVYAEIAMQIKERGDAPQRTEVVNLNAELIETAIEGDYEIASVRFYGLIRENDAANPEPFDEVWHVRKDRRDRRGSWLIAGIQQKD